MKAHAHSQRGCESATNQKFNLMSWKYTDSTLGAGASTSSPLFSEVEWESGGFKVTLWFENINFLIGLNEMNSMNTIVICSDMGL